MSATNVFATAHGTSGPFAVLQTTKSASRKRHRAAEDDGDDDDDNDEDGSDEEDFANFSRATSVALSYASLSANQLAQYRASGLEPGDDIPVFPFPHRSTSPRRNVKLAVLAELEQLTPRLPQVEIAEQGLTFQKHQDTLREQHLAVLTAVLHKMLLQRDWQRAGRAWGLLLRSGYMSRDLRNRTGHRAMDVRTNGRWGIGAEILLRGATEEPDPSTKDIQAENISEEKPSSPPAADRSSDSPGENTPTIGNMPIAGHKPPHSANTYMNDFSESGFEKARRYYERLIVQYPFHHRAQGPRASTFYTAMFSLWIYSVVEKSKQAQFKHMAPPLSSDSTDAEEHRARLDLQPGFAIDSRLVRPIKQEELRGARGIAARLDEVLLTPPYDGDAELLQMRGFVAMWIADLGEEMDRKMERVKAKGFFEKAKNTGQELEMGIEELLVDEDWVDAVDSVEGQDGGTLMLRGR